MVGMGFELVMEMMVGTVVGWVGLGVDSGWIGGGEGKEGSKELSEGEVEEVVQGSW